MEATWFLGFTYLILLFILENRWMKLLYANYETSLEQTWSFFFIPALNAIVLFFCTLVFPIYIVLFLAIALEMIEVIILFRGSIIDKLLQISMVGTVLTALSEIAGDILVIFKIQEAMSGLTALDLVLMELDISIIMACLIQVALNEGWNQFRQAELYKKMSVIFTSLQICILLYLTLEGYIVYINAFTQNAVTMIRHIAICVIALIITMFIVEMGKSFLNLYNESKKAIEYSKEIEQLQKSYDNYMKYTENLHLFKIKYKEMMAHAHSLLMENKTDELRDLICDLNDTLQNTVDLYKQYSNKEIVNAYLQNIADRCIENGIRFSAVVHIPSDIKMTDEELMDITSNMMGGVMGIVDTSKRDPTIKIKSSEDGGEHRITIVADSRDRATIGGEQMAMLRLGQELIVKKGGMVNLVFDNVNHSMTLVIRWY